jgi:hypothetical protein
LRETERGDEEMFGQCLMVQRNDVVSHLEDAFSFRTFGVAWSDPKKNVGKLIKGDDFPLPFYPYTHSFVIKWNINE